MMLPHLESSMDVADLMIARCKQLSGDANIPLSLRTGLNDHETSVCNNVVRVINAAHQLVQTKFKSFESLLKLLVRIFTSLDLLTKHFFVRCRLFKEAVSTSRFDVMVQRVGGELTPKVYDLITSINEVKKNYNTILRNNMLFPLFLYLI
jgi:hypothetical protein